VIAALADVVARYARWGFWKLFDRMRTEGRRWNHKRVHRVYCALRLNLPRRTTRRVPRRVRQPLAAPPVLNKTWALDFMTETLYDGRRVRLLTMIDEGNREGLEIAMGLSLPSRRVIRVLDELVAVHPPSVSTTVPNSPPRPSSTGAPTTRPRFITSSRANPIRTRISNASIAASGPKCSTRISSSRSLNSER
jgi:putative transposase